MKQTIDIHQFRSAWAEFRPFQFSPKAINALFHYIEELESETGVEIEMDLVSLCCEWTEYDSAKEAIFDNKLGNDDDENTPVDSHYYLEELVKWTNVITFDGGILVQDF